MQFLADFANKKICLQYHNNMLGNFCGVLVYVVDMAVMKLQNLCILYTSIRALAIMIAITSFLNLLNLDQ